MFWLRRKSKRRYWQTPEGERLAAAGKSSGGKSSSAGVPRLLLAAMFKFLAMIDQASERLPAPGG